jgi:hypothetical protein
MGGLNTRKRKSSNLSTGAKVKIHLPSELPLELVLASDSKTLTATERLFEFITFPATVGLFIQYFNSPHPALLGSGLCFLLMSAGLIVLNFRIRQGKLSSDRIAVSIPLDDFQADALNNEESEKVVPAKIVSAQLVESRSVDESESVADD